MLFYSTPPPPKFHTRISSELPVPKPLNQRVIDLEVSVEEDDEMEENEDQAEFNLVEKEESKASTEKDFEADKEPKMEEEERIDEGAKGGSESYGSQHDVSLKRKITFDLYSGTFVKKPRLENPLPHSPAQEEDAADRGMTLLDSCARIFAHILTELRSYRTRSF